MGSSTAACMVGMGTGSMGLAEGDSCKQDIDKVPDGHAKVRTVGGQAGVGPRFGVCFKTEHGTATTGEIPHVMVLALVLVLVLALVLVVVVALSLPLVLNPLVLALAPM